MLRHDVLPARLLSACQLFRVCSSSRALLHGCCSGTLLRTCSGGGDLLPGSGLLPGSDMLSDDDLLPVPAVPPSLLRPLRCQDRASALLPDGLCLAAVRPFNAVFGIPSAR